MINAYPRWQIIPLKNKLLKRRVLILTGPRQCGKTTLAKQLMHSNANYRTLDDLTLLNAALSDPHGFVRHGDELMIIDEIQRAPVLLQAIKREVDEYQIPGRFLLTGSANIQTLPSARESLAGRVSTVRLRPLACGEIYGGLPTFLEKAFRGDFQNLTDHTAHAHNHPLYDKDHYLSLALQGGFPEAKSMPQEKDRQSWHRDYIQALIERDLKDITQIKRKDSMWKLIEVLAAWSSKCMDIASICSVMSISRPTIMNYINALEALYLIDRVRPWHNTDYDRVGKQEKFFIVDTGLMAALLNWRFDNIRFDGERNGKLLETFVFHQLATLVDTQEYQYELMHYRDREQREIDFIIQREDGAILGIEVKASSTVDRAMFKHLRWFQANLLKGQAFIGIVLYTGAHTLSFGENLWAVPIHALWS